MLAGNRRHTPGWVAHHRRCATRGRGARGSCRAGAPPAVPTAPWRWGVAGTSEDACRRRELTWAVEGKGGGGAKGGLVAWATEGSWAPTNSQR